MTMISSFLSLTFGLLILVMGFIGYTSAQSNISLIMGSCFGAFMMLSAVFMFKKKIAAFYIGLVLAAILFMSFLFRYFKTHSFMTITMSIISAFIVLLLIFNIIKILKENQN